MIRYAESSQAGNCGDALPRSRLCRSDANLGLLWSSRQSSAKLPSVAGMYFTDAKEALERLNLRVDLTYKQDDRPAGIVIDQSPAPGAIVTNGAQVELKVSKGPPSRTT